jgi:hypothetical protein
MHHALGAGIFRVRPDLAAEDHVHVGHVQRLCGSGTALIRDARNSLACWRVLGASFLLLVALDSTPRGLHASMIHAYQRIMIHASGFQHWRMKVFFYGWAATFFETNDGQNASKAANRVVSTCFFMLLVRTHLHMGKSLSRPKGLPLCLAERFDSDCRCVWLNVLILSDFS